MLLPPRRGRPQTLGNCRSIPGGLLRRRSHLIGSPHPAVHRREDSPHPKRYAAGAKAGLHVRRPLPRLACSRDRGGGHQPLPRSTHVVRMSGRRAKQARRDRRAAPPGKWRWLTERNLALVAAATAIVVAVVGGLAIAHKRDGGAAPP